MPTQEQLAKEEMARNKGEQRKLPPGVTPVRIKGACKVALVTDKCRYGLGDDTLADWYEDFIERLEDVGCSVDLPATAGKLIEAFTALGYSLDASVIARIYRDPQTKAKPEGNGYNRNYYNADDSRWIECCLNG